MKHNYTTEDLLLYVSGEGGEDWRTDLSKALMSDRGLLLQFREIRKWNRFFARLRFKPSNNSLNTIKDHARQSMIIALC
jgi:hypothetical protein